VLVLALFSVPKHLGYLALALLVGAESTGVPVPGETALIAAGLFANEGEMNIFAVIAIAAGAAVVGDNIGYLIGRQGGRRLLEAPGPLEHHRLTVISKGEPFFEKHGPKAVFLGRWVAGLRIAAAWLAGITHMRWRTFFFWNLLGGVAWATSIGLAAYLLGPVAKKIVEDLGLGAVVIVILAIVAYVGWRWRRSRREKGAGTEGTEAVGEAGSAEAGAAEAEAGETGAGEAEASEVEAGEAGTESAETKPTGRGPVRSAPSADTPAPSASPSTAGDEPNAPKPTI
jgi:membrane-associated protein